MKTTYIVWDGSGKELMTDSFAELKSYFKNLSKEDWDKGFGVWVSIYDENRYEVSYDMSWEPYVLDKQADEYVCEEWRKYREWITTLPLDTNEFLALNERYNDFIIKKNRNVWN